MGQGIWADGGAYVVGLRARARGPLRSEHVNGDAMNGPARSSALSRRVCPARLRHRLPLCQVIDRYWVVRGGKKPRPRNADESCGWGQAARTAKTGWARRTLMALNSPKGGVFLRLRGIVEPRRASTSLCAVRLEGAEAPVSSGRGSRGDCSGRAPGVLSTFQQRGARCDASARADVLLKATRRCGCFEVQRSALLCAMRSAWRP
jgi:hypothetical protein